MQVHVGHVLQLEAGHGGRGVDGQVNVVQVSTVEGDLVDLGALDVLFKLLLGGLVSGVSGLELSNGFLGFDELNVRVELLGAEGSEGMNFLELG